MEPSQFDLQELRKLTHECKFPPILGDQTARGLPENMSSRLISEMKTNEVIARHVSLARVFNALYLQIQLSNGAFNEIDVSAGLWNLKNSSTFDKLVHLKTYGLDEQLNILKESFEKVDYLTQLRDLDEMAEKFTILKKITQDDRELLEMKYSSPEIISNCDYFHTFNALKENLAKNVLNKLNITESINTTGKPWAEIEQPAADLGRAILAARDVLPGIYITDSSITESRFNSLNFSEKPLGKLLNSMKASKKVFDQASDFRRLSTLFSNFQNLSPELQSFYNISQLTGIEKILREIQAIFQEFNEQASSTILIAPLFISKQNSSDFWIDEWIKTVLNDETQEIELQTNRFKELLHDARLDLSVFKDRGVSDSLENVLDIISRIKTFRTFLSELNTIKYIDCLNISSLEMPYSFAEIQSLSSTIEKIPNPTRKVMKILESFPYDVYEAKRNMLTYAESISTNPGSTWMDQQTFAYLPQTRELFQNLTDFYELLVQKDTQLFADLANAGEKESKVISWIHNTNLYEKSCDSLFKLDDINDISLVQKRVSRLESDIHIASLRQILEHVPRLRAGLRNLLITSDRKHVSFPMSKKFEGTPEKLLNFAFAAYSLETISKISNISEHLETVINNGEAVLGAIKNITHLKIKQEIEETWSKYPELKKSLEKFRSNKMKLDDFMISVRTEKNLSQIGSIYKEVSNIPFSMQFDFRKMRESLRYLEVPMKDMETSLGVLERLFGINWDLVYTNFVKTPSDMVDLQEEFLRFLESKEESIDWAYVGGAAAIVVFILLTSILGYCIERWTWTCV